MKLPYWPFMVSLVCDLTLEGTPTVMYVGARKDDGTAWEWSAILEGEDEELIGKLFGRALMTFNRAAQC
jgi:hypothetical protein